MKRSPVGDSTGTLRTPSSRLVDLLVPRAVFSYLGVQVVTTVSSFVTVPFLARVLGPGPWGLLLLAQALNTALVVLMEYGFTFTGSRAVARGQWHLSEGGGRVAGIYAARGLLGMIAVGVALAMLAVVPGFREQPLYLALALGWALAAGFGAWWYFLGRGELGRPAALAVTTRILATVAVFAFVRTPADGWMVLAAYGAASVIDSTVMAYWILRQQSPGPRPTVREVIGLLREGAPVFLQQAGGALVGAAGTLVLGGVATQAQVSFFGAGEKLSRAGRQVLNTVSRVLFPRMSALEAADPSQARASRVRLARIGVTIGILAAGLGFVLAPSLVRVLFGPGYEEAVPVIRVLLAAAPFMAVTDLFGTQGLLAGGRDRAFAGVALTVASLGVALSGVLSTRFAHLGMAAGVTLTEVAMATAMLLVWKRGAR